VVFAGLIIRGVDRDRPGGSAWIVKNGLVRNVYCPDGVPYVDENGNIYAWASTNMVFFASGARFAVQFMRQYVALDPRGRYVLLAQNTGGNSWRSWIQSTNLERKELWACKDAECWSLVRAAGKLFALGAANQGNPVCFILDDSGGGLEELQRIDIESGFVQDVDPSGKHLLIIRNGPFASISIYDIKSGRERRCDVAPEYWSFFLKNDPFTDKPNEGVGSEWRLD
jgi:hypothetical protein